VRRQPPQERAEVQAVALGAQPAQDVVLGGAQPLVQVAEQGRAAGGGRDPAGPPVGRVGAALDESGPLESPPGG
jgi:hypothetical protein